MNYKIIIVYNEQTGQIQQALFREILAERESNIPIQLNPIDHPTKFSMVQVPDASFLTIPKKEFLFNDGFWHSFGFNVLLLDILAYEFKDFIVTPDKYIVDLDAKTIKLNPAWAPPKILIQ